MTMFIKTSQQKLTIGIIAGFIIGVVWLVGLRYFTYQSSNIHYHANFALYVNGQRDEFNNFTFYEEVQSCGSDDVNNPLTRVHMHDKVNSVVHVHASGVTWGAFLANLGYTLGDQVLRTDNGTFINKTDGQQLRFILNGQAVDGVANRVIESQDSLLIDYGADTDKTLQERFASIDQNAHEYNQKNDPNSCSGTKSATWQERLKSSIGLN